MAYVVSAISPPCESGTHGLCSGTVCGFRCECSTCQHPDPYQWLRSLAREATARELRSA